MLHTMSIWIKTNFTHNTRHKMSVQKKLSMNKNVGNHGGVIRGAVTQLGTKKCP